MIKRYNCRIWLLIGRHSTIRATMFIDFEIAYVLLCVTESFYYIYHVFSITLIFRKKSLN